jgi:subtilase family serine protease
MNSHLGYCWNWANSFRLVVLFSVWVSPFAGRAAELRTTLSGHVPELVQTLKATGNMPAELNLSVAIALPLRNQAALGNFLADLQDPRRTNYHRYLSGEEFSARFGPTETDYASVVEFAKSHGLKVVRQHSNRLILDVEGEASSFENTFQVSLKRFAHPTEGRVFFAPVNEPSVPVGIPILEMWGLSD